MVLFLPGFPAQLWRQASAQMARGHASRWEALNWRVRRLWKGSGKRQIGSPGMGHPQRREIVRQREQHGAWVKAWDYRTPVATSSKACYPVYGRKKNAPARDIHLSTPRTWDYVTLCGKGELRLQMKLRLLISWLWNRESILECLGGSSVISGSL